MAGVDSGISFGRPALLQVEPRSLLLSIGLHWLRLQYYTQVGPWGPPFWCHAPVFRCGAPLGEDDKKNKHGRISMLATMGFPFHGCQFLAR